MESRKCSIYSTETYKINKNYIKPDGGYGYVILFVGFTISFILDGCMYGFGIVLDEIKSHFKVTQDLANLISSLNLGISFITGPIVSALAKQFGCRLVVMCSSAVFALMYVVSAFSSSIYIIIVAFGFIGGIAFGCSYLTCFIILNDYFDKKMGTVNGLTMAGSGLGAFAFSPFIQILIENFGWQIAMIILGGITLQGCVLGALLRPVDSYLKCIHTTEPNSLNKTTISNDKLEEAIKQTEQGFIHTLKSLLKETLNFKILGTNLGFLFYSLASFFSFVAYMTPFIYIPIRAKELKIDNFPWIISTIGIVNIPARVIMGLLCDKKLIQPFHLYIIGIFLAALACFSFYLLINFWLLVSFGAVYGICSAAINALIIPCINSLNIETKKFSNAYGILFLFAGVGNLLGLYVCGFISENWSILYAFLFSGFCFLISLALTTLASFRNICLKKSKAKTQSSVRI